MENKKEPTSPNILYKRHLNPGHTSGNEGFVQRYEKIKGGIGLKPGNIVFSGTLSDCNIITNNLNSGVISETDVSILRDISSYAEHQSAMMLVSGTYPPLKTPLYDINEITIALCYKMSISAVPYTSLNTQKWQEVVNNSEPQKIINSLAPEKIAKMEDIIAQYRDTYNVSVKDTNRIPLGGKDMYNDVSKSKQEYSKEEIKQAENVDIQGFLSSTYTDQVTAKGNQLLFKNAKGETVSINISDSDKHGLFFNTVTQNSGKGIINFLRQETGSNFKNAVGTLLTYSQKQHTEKQTLTPGQSEEEKTAIARNQERKLNIECGKAIDQAINDNCTRGEMAGTGYYNMEAATKFVIDKYGVDRVTLVLATNINAAEHDGRIANVNKAWAKSLNAPDTPDFHLHTHRAILDGFANKFRAVTTTQQAHENQNQSQTEQKTFVPPQKTETSQNAENYLTGKMSFDKGIIKSCIEKGSIYQTEVHSEKLGKNIPCAVFAGFDEKGAIQSAVIKGFGSYENVEAGSQLKYAFMLPAKERNGKQATAISVFDNPIEVLAGATLAKMKDKTNYANIHRLSVVKTWLLSTHVTALKTFLENNPQIKTVNLCLTNTEDGHKIADKMQFMLEELSKHRGEAIKVNDLIPKDTKGFQEQLQNKVGEIKENRKAKEKETRE